ncbi:MAG: helix-turn-helix domain-containing protein [Acidimicrobiales bacterium]
MTLRLVSDDGGSEELPLVLSVEEAARILRIGRSAAYEQARIFRVSGGREGLSYAKTVSTVVEVR